MNWLEIITAISSAATAAGVILAWRQLKQNAEQARTQFEDELTKQYRDIVSHIPAEAMLGGHTDYKKSSAAFYRYIDLCNEQVFLRMEGRITKTTWNNWSMGIRSHLERPAFRDAWTDIKSKLPESFRELTWLQDSGYADDPRVWKDHPPSKSDHRMF